MFKFLRGKCNRSQSPIGYICKFFWEVYEHKPQVPQVYKSTRLNLSVGGLSKMTIKKAVKIPQNVLPFDLLVFS